jgi:S1-C subfamily serine protease
MATSKPRVTLSFTWHFLVAGLLMLFLIVCGLGFGGYKLYAKVIATEKTQALILAAQNTEQVAKEAEAQKLIDTQQAELANTKTLLAKTENDAQKTSARVLTLSQALDDSKAQKEIVISSNDLTMYTTGVVQILCTNPQGVSSGSGTLWTFKEVPHAILTNYHVVKDASKCAVIMTNSANTPTGIFSLKPSIYTYNSNTDEAVLEIGDSISSVSVPVANYNYSFVNLRKCATPVPVGAPVVIIGFPAYAKRDSTITVETIGTVNSIFRTVTNGIVSGYDTSGAGAANYFVSAKIDAGNSGGIALAKDQGGLCSLGLPTWLTVGNYETQGLVQNIVNILPTK